MYSKERKKFNIQVVFVGIKETWITGQSENVTNLVGYIPI